MIDRVRNFVPVLDWGRRYDRKALSNDLIAAVIVTIMLIPQSLAYALLAGLPPEAGIYASILPIILYAIFGTSRALAVGPVAVVSLMTTDAEHEPSQFEGYVRQAAEWAGIGTSFGPLITLVAIAFWLKAAILLVSRRQVGYAVAQVATDLRLELLNALLQTSWSYYARQPAGAAVAAISSEAGRASSAYQVMARILGYFVELCVYAAIAFAIQVSM